MATTVTIYRLCVDGDMENYVSCYVTHHFRAPRQLNNQVEA